MASNFSFETSVSYETAGVGFNFSLKSASGGDGPAFNLTVDDLATGQRVALNHRACPAVHDFTRGYTRWLGTKGIRAVRGDDEITGTAGGDLSSVQLLSAAHDALDMIDQKFPNYRGPIIGSDDYSDIVLEKRTGWPG